MLHIFEDNEAVVKMIIKGRSPTMRHVSRIHRVHGGSSSVDQASECGSDMGPLSPRIDGHIALHGGRLLHGQEIYGKQPGVLMDDLNVNLAIWRRSMNTTLQAAVHLGRKFAKNHIWDSLEQLFEEIKRRICELSEVLGPRTPEIVGLKIIEFEDTTWRSISL